MNGVTAVGKKSFQADYISHDGTRVTLKRKDGRILTFQITKLHQDDQAWLLKTHPLKKKTAAEKVREVPKGAAFDTLKFGDTRKEVEKKLKASPAVVSNVEDTYLHRLGLNGSYRTKATIGGLHCFLFFDWTKSGHLREVTLRSKPLPESFYGGRIESSWREMINLLNTLHGQPKQNADFPKSSDLVDGSILGSHLWHTEDGHSVILGHGSGGEKLQCGGADHKRESGAGGCAVGVFYRLGT